MAQYCALFADITSTRKVWNPSIGEAFVCFTEEENFHDRKAVAVTCAEVYVVGHLSSETSGLVSISSSMEAKLMVR